MAGKPKMKPKRRPSKTTGPKRQDLLLLDPDDVVTDDDPRHPHCDPARARERQPDDAMVRNVAARGVIELVVCQRTGGMPWIVAGNRRVRAARKANELRRREGADPIRVKAVVYQGADTSGVAMAENHVRQDETPLCSAEWIRRYTEDEGRTLEEAADAMGRTVSWAKNTLALLRAAPAVRGAVDAGMLSTTAAAVLVRRTPDHAAQERMLAKAGADAARDRNEPGTVKVRQIADGPKRPTVRQQRRALADLSCRADDFGRGAAAALAWVLDGSEHEGLRMERP